MNEDLAIAKLPRVRGTGNGPHDVIHLLPAATRASGTLCSYPGRLRNLRMCALAQQGKSRWCSVRNEVPPSPTGAHLVATTSTLALSIKSVYENSVPA